MTVTAVRKDPASRSMSIAAEFDASPERVWLLWADPRQLERWWGPPTYPATVTSHDLTAGGRDPRGDPLQLGGTALARLQRRLCER